MSSDAAAAAATRHATAAPAHQFDTPAQQRETASLGMWVFLVTELMFFGGLFLVYIVYRYAYPRAFALGSHELDIVLGTTNTVVLIASSLTMALAVRSAQIGRRRPLVVCLVLTMILVLSITAALVVGVLTQLVAARDLAVATAVSRVMVLAFSAV